MNTEIEEIIEAAAEKYADEICRELPPPERETHKTLLANAYFRGAAEMLEVLKEVVEGKIEN